jgi:hypothetical protein
MEVSYLQQRVLFPTKASAVLISRYNQPIAKTSVLGQCNSHPKHTIVVPAAAVGFFVAVIIIVIMIIVTLSSLYFLITGYFFCCLACNCAVFVYLCKLN